MKHTIVAAALALASISSAYAASISGLVNTGVGNSGTADTHYALSNGASESTPIITYDNVWPVDGTWLNNTPGVSRWITPTGNQGQSLDPSVDGIYTYSLNFSLAGYNANSAWFNARVASDNSVVVKLNGTQIYDAVGFASWHDFSVASNSGLFAAQNTLEFIVTNDALSNGNPTGLRVEFLASNVAAVPEPATYGMLLGGLALMGMVARRRKQQ